MSKSVLLLQTLEMLKRRPGITMSELAAGLGRSPRTIYRYLSDLTTELDVPIYCQNGAYRVVDSPELGALSSLSSDEASAVRFALSSAAASSGGAFASAAESALRKIEASLPHPTFGVTAAVEDCESEPPVSATETTVRVRFSPQAAHIARKVSHQSSHAIEETEDGGIVLTFTVARAEDLAGWILGYGAEAEVLEPQDLRRKMTCIANRILCLYQQDSVTPLVSGETAGERCGRCN